MRIGGHPSRGPNNPRITPRERIAKNEAAWDRKAVARTRSTDYTLAMKKEIGEILGNYEKGVRELALETRKLVLALMPEAMESVDVKGRIIGYGFGTRYMEMVCVIMPTKVGVTLGIGYAMDFPDPANLLQGEGKVHRHVRLRSSDDVELPALRALLKHAIKERKRAIAENKKAAAVKKPKRP